MINDITRVNFMLFHGIKSKHEFIESLKTTQVVFREIVHATKRMMGIPESTKIEYTVCLFDVYFRFTMIDGVIVEDSITEVKVETIVRPTFVTSISVIGDQHDIRGFDGKF